MIEFLPLIKVAYILGCSFTEARRLTREKRLKVHHVQNRVRYFDPVDVLEFIKRRRVSS